MEKEKFNVVRFHFSVCMMALMLAGCFLGGKDDEIEDANMENDPEGTIQVDLTDDYIGGYYDGIYIGGGNLRGALFLSKGKVDGLGSISTINKSGWADKAAIMEGCGYVAWMDDIFYRLYVVSYADSVRCIVKYTEDFVGSEKEILLKRESVSIPADEDDSPYDVLSDTVGFQNKTLFPFRVSSSDSWCRASAISMAGDRPYDAVRIRCSKNEERKSRECVVSVESEVGKKEIKVVQEAADSKIGISTSALSFEGGESSKSVRITANTRWKVSSKPEWCTTELDTDTNYLKVTVKENLSGKERTGNIVVKTLDGKVSQTLTVAQGVPSLRLSADKVTLGAGESTEKLSVYSEVTSWQVKSSATWLKAVKSDDNKTVILTSEENSSEVEREASVTVYLSASQQATITVRQKVPSFSVYPSLVTLNAVKSSKSVTVSSESSSWQFSCSATWLKVVRSGNELTLTADENLSGVEREASVSVYLSANLKRTITVRQKAASFSLSASMVTLDAVKSSQSVTVSSELDTWQFSCSATWLKVVRSGNELTLTADENSSGIEREVSVTVYLSASQKETIMVRQEAPSFSLPKEVELVRSSSTKTLSNVSNISSWSVSSNQTWCTVTKDYRDNIHISVSGNSTQRKREGEITITLANKTYQIPVIQCARDVGDYYNVNGVEGVVYEISDYGEHGMIVSLDEENIAWSTRIDYQTGAVNTIDGSKNMERIKSFDNWEEEYPAFKWCNDKNINGITGWYLPAIGQLREIDKNIDKVNATLKTIAGKFPIRIDLSEHYWSSTEYSLSNAWIYTYGCRYKEECHEKNRVVSYDNKYYVRAVKAF